MFQPCTSGMLGPTAYVLCMYSICTHPCNLTCWHLLSTCREEGGFNGTEEQVETDCYGRWQAPDCQHDQRQELGGQQHVPHYGQPCNSRSQGIMLVTTSRT